jgi:anthranilate phosphoribosyltransferase
VDTCGTGGSGLDTVNTSTLVAFALAARGIPVAKHGNRASSGRCGSFDVLERMGVPIDLSPSACAALLERERLAFLFAPSFHPAMRRVGPVRRQLGFRTVFNLLGPLCNPAGVGRQLLGVSDVRRAPSMVRSLAALDCRRALVVCGEDGLDELSLCAPTRLWVLEEGRVREKRIRPEDFGLRTVRFDRIAGGSPHENARHFEKLLDGGRDDLPRRQHLALNVAAGLFVAGEVHDIADGLPLAFDLLDSGRLRKTFERYRTAARVVEPIR